MNFFGGGSEPVKAAEVESSSNKQVAEAVKVNPLLDNLERTVFTFNMHNLAEMCFSHVVKRSSLQKDSNILAIQRAKGVPASMEP